MDDNGVAPVLRATNAGAPRAAQHGDLEWMLALNRRHETELSPLDETSLQRLVAHAAFVRVADPGAAFLIALDQDAAYDSPNFLWFRARYPRFLYVDRIVVDGHFRGSGLAGRLYGSLFDHARHIGHGLVTCEVNREPPNPVSDRFHDRFGFVVAGSARLENSAKAVTYLARTLPCDPATGSRDEAGEFG